MQALVVGDRLQTAGGATAILTGLAGMSTFPMYGFVPHPAIGSDATCLDPTPHFSVASPSPSSPLPSPPCALVSPLPLPPPPRRHVEVMLPDTGLEVFNFEVDTFHTYYAGGILVHNNSGELFDRCGSFTYARRSAGHCWCCSCTCPLW